MISLHGNTGSIKLQTHSKKKFTLKISNYEALKIMRKIIYKVIQINQRNFSCEYPKLNSAFI